MSSSLTDCATADMICASSPADFCQAQLAAAREDFNRHRIAQAAYCESRRICEVQGERQRQQIFNRENSIRVLRNVIAFTRHSPADRNIMLAAEAELNKLLELQPLNQVVMPEMPQMGAAGLAIETIEKTLAEALECQSSSAETDETTSPVELLNNTQLLLSKNDAVEWVEQCKYELTCIKPKQLKINQSLLEELLKTANRQVRRTAKMHKFCFLNKSKKRQEAAKAAYVEALDQLDDLHQSGSRLRMAIEAQDYVNGRARIAIKRLLSRHCNSLSNEMESTTDQGLTVFSTPNPYQLTLVLPEKLRLPRPPVVINDNGSHATMPLSIVLTSNVPWVITNKDTKYLGLAQVTTAEGSVDDAVDLNTVIPHCHDPVEDRSVWDGYVARLQ